MAVHRDDALDHPVEDRGDLRALLLEVLDLLAQPRREDVQRPAEGADLVGRARGRADEEIALAHLAGDGLHVDHRARHAAGDEDADAERDQQRHAAAREQHLVERGVGRGHGGQGEREPQHADHAPGVPHRPGDVEERRVDRGAASQVATEPALERRPDLRAIPVIVEACQVFGPPVGFRDDAAVGGDQGDARARRARHAQDEGLDRRGGAAAAQEAPRLVLDHAGHRGQALLERLDGELLERVVQKEARRHHRDAHEAHQGQGELEGDAPADGADDGAHHSHLEPVAHALHGGDALALVAELHAQPPHVDVDGPRLDLARRRVAPHPVEEELPREHAARAPRRAPAADRTPWGSARLRPRPPGRYGGRDRSRAGRSPPAPRHRGRSPDAARRARARRPPSARTA